MSDTNETAEHVDEAAAGSPEDVVAQLRTQLQQRDTEAATERQRREAAELRERQIGTAMVGAHDVALQARLSAEESAVSGARAKMTQAREAGDLSAEQDAIEALATARQNVNALKGEQTRLATQRTAPPASQQESQQSGGSQQYSSAAHGWIARNPKFNTDRIYRSVAEGAHAQALEMGIQADSPAYFKHLDDTLSKTFATQQQGNAEGMEKERQQPASKQTSRPPASSFATPPSRGNATNARGNADVNAIAGALGVTAEDIKQFADHSNMKLDEYCKQQSQILEERRRGGSGGLDGSDAVFQ